MGVMVVKQKSAGEMSDQELTSTAAEQGAEAMAVPENGQKDVAVRRLSRRAVLGSTAFAGLGLAIAFTETGARNPATPSGVAPSPSAAGTPKSATPAATPGASPAATPAGTPLPSPALKVVTDQSPSPMNHRKPGARSTCSLAARMCPNSIPPPSSRIFRSRSVTWIPSSGRTK